MPRPEPAARRGGLTFAQGTAMYVGAVLGTGVIVLPALAADVAGPASLLAWLLLVVLSLPLAGTFAALAARYPDAGGVSTFARLAFGERAAAVAGYCFFLAIPPGTAAGALFGGAYVEAAVGGGTATTTIVGSVILVLVAAVNFRGVQVSGRMQFALSGLLVAIVLVAVGSSVPNVRADNFEPFAPEGWLAIGPAAALLVWSFAGWEAITHLAAEFRRPDRDLTRATGAAVVIVGVLYLAVAAAVIGVLGAAAADSDAPLGELLARAFGGDVRLVSAVAAVLLTVGSMNAYFAGGAKLAAALGRDGALPAGLARGSQAGEVPRRGLVLVSGLALVSLLTASLTGLGTYPLVLLTTGQFVAVYAIGMAAALRLLPRRTLAWAAAAVALAVVAVLLVMTGIYLLWPLLAACAALLYLRRGQRRSTPPAAAAGRPDPPDPDAVQTSVATSGVVAADPMEKER